MKKVKLLKALMFTFAVSMCVGMFGHTAYAAGKTVREVEPNDTMDTAMEISPNKTSAADSAEGKSTYNVVNGSIKNGDHDWYKVYFKEGRQYVNLDAAEKQTGYDVKLYKENGDIVDEWSYTKTYAGLTGFDYEVTSGYYYIELIGNTSSSVEYSFTAGDPHYTMGTKKTDLGSITVAPKESIEFPLDWSEENLPKDAVVYSIRVSGPKRSDLSSIKFTNLTKGQDIMLVSYPWYKSTLCSYDMPAKSNWILTFRYGSSNLVTFTPEVSIAYMYPIGREGNWDNFN